MKLIEESFNSFNVRILSRDGRFLCSPRDPIKEAQDWLSRQKIESTDRQIIVLGAGAGHHLQEILKAHENLKVCVVELDSTTLKFSENYWTKNGIGNDRLQWLGEHEIDGVDILSQDLILNFRPAWAHSEAQYMQLYFQLTQNSPPSLSRAAKKLGLSKTQEALEKHRPGLEFSLKDLDFAELDEVNEEVKFWRTLRELIE